MWTDSTWDTGERVLESCLALGAWECGPLWTLFSSSLDMLDQRMAPSTYSRLYACGTLEKGPGTVVQHWGPFSMNPIKCGPKSSSLECMYVERELTEHLVI